MTLFYRTALDLDAGAEGDVVWQTVASIRYWLTPKWRSCGVGFSQDAHDWAALKRGGLLLSDDGNETVRVVSRACAVVGEPGQWACSITETIRKPGQNDRLWVTEVSLVHRGPATGRVTVMTSFGDRPGFFGPSQETPSATIPGLVRVLIGNPHLSVTVSGMPASLEPRKLSVGDFPAFWRMVSSPVRDVPLVYISPVGKDGQAATVVDPYAVSYALGPSAIVCYSSETAFSDEMRHCLPSMHYGCAGGGVKVYAPRPDTASPDDWKRHRAFQRERIADMGEEAFVLMLRRAIARDINFWERIPRVDDVDARARRLAEIRRLKGRLRDTEEQSLELLSELEEDLEVARKKANGLVAANEELKARVRTLGERAAAAERACGEQESCTVSTAPGIGHFSAATAARALGRMYPGKLAFTERAWDSLEECDTDPGVVWNALYDLATILPGLYESDDSCDVARAFNENSEFEYARGAGSATRKDKRLMNGYRDTYRGKTIDVQTHIKKGSKAKSGQFIRVYFGYDAEEGKVIISSVGGHIENHSTRALR